MEPKYLIRGRLVVPGLFIETCGENLDLAEFTLGPDDRVHRTTNKLLRSMHKLFVKYKDPTGYDFAISELGSYEHFLKMRAHPVVGEHIERWVEEVKSGLDSESINEIKRIAKDGGSQAELSAAKWLASREYDNQSKDVGRPSNKKSIIKDKRQAEEMSLSTKRELDRLGLTH